MGEPSGNWSLLLAEDDTADAELVSLGFRKQEQQPEISVVPTVRQALEHLRQRRFDVVVCDLRLRDGSGLEIVRHIRDFDPSLPILILTGYGSQQEAIEAIRNGANEYYLKNQDTFARLPQITAAMVAGSRNGEGRPLTIAELELTRDRFRDYAEAASDWFWETDSDRRFTFVSRAEPDRPGIDPASFVGRTISDVVGAHGTMRATDERWGSSEVLRFGDLVFTTSDDDGNPCAIRLSGKPFFARNGEFLGYRGVGKDISEDRKAEQELVAAKTEAESANRAKTRFLAVMSHELRTPLNAIIGFSESLLNGIAGPPPERFVEYLDDIRVAGRHLLNVVNDVLDLSKIEAGYYDLGREPLDVRREIHESVQFLANLAAAGEVTIEVRDDTGPALIEGDPRAVRQVLINVISNAVKFTPPGGRIEIATERRDGGLAVAVADTGVGIPEDKIEEVLKPFHQVDNLLTRRYEGTGLGLPIAKGLMEAHGGDLEIVSELDRGTTVRLVFPDPAA